MFLKKLQLYINYKRNRFNGISPMYSANTEVIKIDENLL